MPLLMFVITWYFFMTTTAGCQIPGGLFVPAMIIGCAIGSMVNNFKNDICPECNPVVGQSYEIMGCGAMLAGFTRQTYSLAVIMLETTQQINFFIPIVLTILTASSVGKIFVSQSLYERALRMKNLPLLRNHVPKSQTETTAYQIMTALVLTVEGIVSVEYLQDILQKPYSTYPVLNSAGNIVGVMPKNFLIVLIENHHWVDMNKLTMAQKRKLTKMYQSLDKIEFDQKTVTTIERRISNLRGVVGPQDWYMKEFSKQTMQYFKDHQNMLSKFETFGEEEKEEILAEHQDVLDAYLTKSGKSKDRASLVTADKSEETQPMLRAEVRAESETSDFGLLKINGTVENVPATTEKDKKLVNAIVEEEEEDEADEAKKSLAKPLVM